MCIFAKDVCPLKGTEGSNPSPSAKKREHASFFAEVALQERVSRSEMGGIRRPEEIF